MYNKVILVGRITKEPEFVNTKSGTVIAKLSLATDNGYGEKKTTDFHNLVVFGKTVEVVQKFIHKGQLTLIDGRINYQQYEKDGIKRTSTSIIVNSLQMLGRNTTAEQSIPNYSQPQAQQQFQPDFTKDDPFATY